MRRFVKAFGALSERGISGAVAAFVIAGVIVGAGFSATTLSGFSQESHSASSASAKEGKAIFEKRCIVCHNKKPGNNSPFGPPNLHGIFRASSPLKITPSQAIVTITHGKGNMPAFGKVLTNSQIKCVVAYLKTQ